VRAPTRVSMVTHIISVLLLCARREAAIFCCFFLAPM
jgi:hypothetical protein